MNVSHVLREENGLWQDTASVLYGMRHAKAPRELYFRSTQASFSPTSDHLLPLSILMAMVDGDPIRIQGSVSPRLISNQQKIQMIFQAFMKVRHQDLARVEVEADTVEAHDWPAGRGVAAFFSGGVDSTFTALRRRDELDALIFIQGQDVDVRDGEWLELSAARARRAAAEIGLPLIEIETDISRFIGRASVWSLAFGTSLASVALLLQPTFSKIYIAGGRSYARLLPAGTHPMLDPLWGTEGMEVAHDGADMERWQKVQYLADKEIAQKHLRICFERRTAPPYNCGQCPKCLTTMFTLAALGALDRFPVFEKPLDFDAIANLDAGDPATRSRIEDTIAILDGPDGRTFPELREALILSLERWVSSLSTPRDPNFAVGTWRARLWPERAGIGLRDT